MPVPSQRKYDKEHIKNLNKYSYQIRKSYNQLINEIAKLTFNLSLNKNNEFYFRNYSEVNKKVNELIKQLNIEVYGTTVSGINTEWELAVEKNNELALFLYGKELSKLPAKYKEAYLSNNEAALKNFLKRKDKGLSLSDKVWRNSRQIKQELELAIELNLKKGKSAAAMARDIKQYLNDPDKLFRRVKDESGVLRLSKAAKAYNPGQGRYRSSYKNALRLARNEINFSYEGSNTEKRNQADYIVGVKIKVSPSHKRSDDKGGISCYKLQGLYPKDFDFTSKWHVNCKCTSFQIVKSKEEINEDIDKILNGKEPDTKSKNEVEKMPESYKKYIKDNKKKWVNWKNQPRTFETNKEVK